MDLIKNVHTLFDERPPLFPPIPSPYVPKIMSQVAPLSVAEWRLQIPSRLPLQPDAQTVPQTPTESVVSSISDYSRSSATSLQTTLG